MTWTYTAGSATPSYAGLVDLAGVRINDRSGSFISQALTGLTDTPPIVGGVSQLPYDHGGIASKMRYGPRTIQIDGWSQVTGDVTGVLTAMDYLRNQLILTLGEGQTATLISNRLGWATRRQCDVRLAGEIVFPEPDVEMKKVATRVFSIPLVAPDPLLYDADHLRTQDLPLDGTPVAITNAGNAPAPFTVRFTGPWTSVVSLETPSVLVDGFGAELVYSQGAVAGAYIDVSTYPQSHDDGRTVVSNTGDSHYFNLGDMTLTTIPPGTTNFVAVASGTSGASKATITWRDAWA